MTKFNLAPGYNVHEIIKWLKEHEDEPWMEDDIQMGPPRSKGICRKCGKGELRFHHSGNIDAYEYYIYECTECGYDPFYWN